MPQIEMEGKFQVSRDSQALYMTLVTKDRLPVFRTDAIKTIVCKAIDEARKSAGFLLFSVFSEAVFMQKVNYIHQNPVRAGW
jgi:hypothetical protein